MAGGGASEDLIQGGSGRRPLPRWLRAGTVALVVAVAAVVVVPRLGSTPAPDPRRAEASGPAPTVARTASPAPSWPTTAGACGQDVLLPDIRVEALHEATGLTLLLGGRALREVVVDEGWRSVGGLTRSQVTSLGRNTAGVYGLEHACDEGRGGRAFLVTDGRGTRPLAAGRRFDDLLVAPDSAWGLRYPGAGRQRLALRPLDGGPVLRLPRGFEPVSATRRRFVGVVTRPPSAPDARSLPTVATLDRRTGRMVASRPGWVAAAAGDVVVTRGGCEPGTRCVLTNGASDGSVIAAHELPDGRMPASAGVLSPDGRRLAVQLTRASSRPVVGHPGPSSDVAVVDLTSGRVDVVQGIELAPKSAAGLAFSRDGRWLVMAVNDGRRTRMLLWRAGLARAVEPPFDLPGAVQRDTPVLAVGDG